MGAVGDVGGNNNPWMNTLAEIFDTGVTMQLMESFGFFPAHEDAVVIGNRD